jgi:hypothetical protein
MTQYRCLNCPSKPIFADLEQIKDHWKDTHVSPMMITVPDPWNERPPKTIALYEAIAESA